MSFKIIPGIHCLDDGFRFDTHGLSCFIVPKYLASRAFHPLNADLFYLYVYLYDHYDLFSFFNKATKELYTPYFFHNLLVLARYVLEQKLGLELCTVQVQEEPYSQIVEVLDQGWPVFVPVDRGELFYSCAYHRIVDPHLLLIKGYNPDTHIFVTHDFEQNYHLLHDQPTRPTGDVYSQFYIMPEIVTAANRSFNQHFDYYKNEIKFLRPMQSAPVQTSEEALKDVATELAAHLSHVPALLAEKFRMFHNQSDYPFRERMSYINSQQILLITLTKLLQSFTSEKEQEQLIKEAGWSAWNAWKSYMLVSGVMEIRQKYDQNLLKSQRDKILQAEKAFLESIVSLL